MGGLYLVFLDLSYGLLELAIISEDIMISFKGSVGLLTDITMKPADVLFATHANVILNQRIGKDAAALYVRLTTCLFLFNLSISIYCILSCWLYLCC